MADSGDHSQIASGGSTESAMFERSTELSAFRTGTFKHGITSLSPVTAMPLPAKTLISHRVPPRDTAAFADQCGLTEKRRKLDVPGLNNTTTPGDKPHDMTIAKCQKPEMLA